MLALALILTGTKSFGAASCTEVFTEGRAGVARGTDLGPLEWLRNLKQKSRPSNPLRQFDSEKYHLAFENIKNENLRVEKGFRPKNSEEAVAYLDVQLESLSLSIQQMPPVLRLKAYSAVQKILNGSASEAAASSNLLVDAIFRGNYQKPTSFAYLLTHTPKQASHEIFVQHLHKLVIADIIHSAYEVPSGPTATRAVERMSSKFISEHREAISTGFWTAVSIASAWQAPMADGLFLSPFNVLKLKSNKLKIERSLREQGLERTLLKLEPEFQNKNDFNYFYALSVKAMNWYVIASLVAVVF